MKEAVALAGGIVMLILALTLLGNGSFSLGTGAAGPYASFGFKGPYGR
jgi:hypothetical protein